MKVHYACSISHLAEFQDNYRLICRKIKESGHEIVHDWIDEAIERLNGKPRKYTREETYILVENAINEADVIVAEGTVESFSVGHQITIALQREKPVLFLVFGDKRPLEKFPHIFIDKSKMHLVMHATYNFENLSRILDNFFELYKGGGKFRFNLLLDQEVRDYLNFASRHYGKSRSTIIRDLVLKAAHSDKNMKMKRH